MTAKLLQPLPKGSPVRILNPDLTPPLVGYVNAPAAGECTALLTQDHASAMLLPGHSAIAYGIALARATIDQLAMIDKEECLKLIVQAIELRVALADLLDDPSAGVVRDRERMQ